MRPGVFRGIKLFISRATIRQGYLQSSYVRNNISFEQGEWDLLIFKTRSQCKLALRSALRDGRQRSGTTAAVCANSCLLLVTYKDVFISRLGSCFLRSFPKCDTIRSYSPQAILLTNSEQSQKGVGRIQQNLKEKNKCSLRSNGPDKLQSKQRLD